jgi:hypothetical protein
MKWTNVSEERNASIIVLMMEAVSTSETSVQFNVNEWRYIPEDSKVHRCKIHFSRHCVGEFL